MCHLPFARALYRNSLLNQFAHNIKSQGVGLSKNIEWR